jgi:hypothetical protein
VLLLLLLLLLLSARANDSAMDVGAVLWGACVDCSPRAQEVPPGTRKLFLSFFSHRIYQLLLNTVVTEVSGLLHSNLIERTARSEAI